MIDKLKRSLSSERVSTKSITAFVIFGMIVLVFVFFGYQTRGGGAGPGAAASVNGALISLSDLKSETARLEQMYSQFFGGNFPASARRQITKEAIDSLVSREVMYQSAAKAGVQATDAEVRDFIIREMKAFQKDGRFSRDLYQQVLTANRMTAPEFEEKVRRDLVAQRARRVFEVAGQATRLEMDRQKELKENKYNFAFVHFNKDQMLEKMPVAEAEIQAKLNDPEFKKKIEADFAANKALYSTEEQVRAQHILIKVDSKKPDAEKAALNKIKELYEKAKTADFATLAKQNSEDTGSKDKGGDLGYFSRGKMLPEFEKVAFDAVVGKVTEPVKSMFGYHLIKVLDKKPAQEAKLENVQKKIASKLINMDKYEAQLKNLEVALAAGDQAQTDKWVREMGLNWEETGFFDLTTDVAPKMGSATATRSALEANEGQPLLRRLVRDGENKYVIRFKGTKKESADAKDMATNLSRERSMELFSQWVQGEAKTAKIQKNAEMEGAAASQVE